MTTLNQGLDNKELIKAYLIGTQREGIKELIECMERIGFFTAPCSGKYHLCEVGGLAEHSLNVLDNARTINEAMGYLIDEDSIVIAALLHDLGKCGDYGKPNYVKNILKSGKVSESEPYKTNKDLAYIPHEVRSLTIAERYIFLTEDESHAIYYHNGKYTHIGYDLQERPLQMIIHFADLWASRVNEV